ncbi:hypothetical protein GH5_03448 [Leishmania sp. Ghana 2012 LV757]|uniref:hypothetical protein n=1 Tax=Leishmania sp. Ghana 2012 LV757 TaxID=2803181 RepID=UPI001B563DC6|nr:hypothetical protein GH5_03448 [Leishmania sp. Ghana 2012 LV757]
MSRSSPSPPSHAEAAVSVKSYARLPDNTAGESSSNGRGPSGRWADALLKTTSHGAAPAPVVPEMASQPTHKPLSRDRSQAASTITGHACGPLRQQQNAPDSAFPYPLNNGNRGGSLATSVASPRAIAVAVHPQFSRVPQRSLSVAAPTPAPVSLATASVAAHASTNNTASANATPACDQLLNQALPAPLPPPVTGAATGPTDASAAFAMLRNASDPPQPAPNTADRRPKHASAPAHMHSQQLQAPLRTGRVEGNSSCGCSVSIGSGSPVASAATPHTLPITCTSSPFFQRVLDAVATLECSSDAPRAAVATVSAVAQDDQETSMLQLQDVTPITNAGDSEQESQLLSHPRATTQSLSGVGQYSYKDETDGVDAGAGALPSVFCPMVTNAPSRPLPLTGAYSAASSEDAPLWRTLPPARPPPCPTARVLSCQQLLYSPCVCNIRQVAPAKPSSQSVSLSDTAQLSGTPGGLSTSQSVTTCSTGQRRSRGAMPAAADNCTSMSSAGHFTSPESVSQHFSGIYASPPPLSSQTYVGVRDQRSASILTPASNGRSDQSTNAAGCTPLMYTHVPHQQHLSLQQCRVGGVGGNGTYGGGLPSSPNPAAAPLAIWTSRPAATGAATRATMAAVQEKRSATSTVPAVQGAAGGALSLPTVASSLSSVALEKQLLHASKGDLVQVLLELASCNLEASRFIHSKAFFFAFRHEHGGEAADAREACAAANLTTRSPAAGAEKKAWGHARHGGSGLGGVSKAVDVPSSDLTRQEPRVLKQIVTDVAPLSGTAAAHDHSIARCIFPVEAADDEDCDFADSPAVIGRPDPAGAEGAANASVSQRLPHPEGRAFSTELHPCLRWYGACRNAMSCVYASVPRNVCLNWIRGSCMACTDCSGVHRLPSPCPPEVRRIYELNHGRARRDTPVTVCAGRVSVGHVLPIPPPFPAFNSVALSPFVSGSTATAAPASSPAHDVAAELTEHCAGTSGDPAACRAVTKEPEEESMAVRTPTSQSIRKDTLLGGGSTPHRHAHGRGAELSLSAMAIERSGCVHTVAAGDVSSSGSLDMDTATKDEEPVDHEMLQYTGGILAADADAAPPRLCSVGVPSGSRMSGMASSAGSSRCSTAEGCCSCSNSVSRYLGPEFDRAATVAPEWDDGRPDSAAMGLSMHHQPPGVKTIKSICDCVCDAKGALQVIPVRPGGDSAELLADMDDECDLSAPAAGTRTRMQSPLYR